ncbi:MAG: hypothetical protein GXZ03_01340 [Proteiniphilum sp.]|nr:hypothetical protein [Proteiniphilum sp.]
MKKIKLKTLFLLFCVVPLLSIASGKNNDNDKDYYRRMDDIYMHKQDNPTRSASAIELEVATDGSTLVEVIVSGYVGDVTAKLLTGRGSITKIMYVNDFGADYIDISRLRAGKYTLKVEIGSEEYEGTVIIK